MKYTHRFVLLAALFAGLGCTLPAYAETPRASAAPGFAQAERNAVELKQGMSLAEVQRLLGKPRRTALKDSAGYSATASQANLRWTYVWSTASSSDHVLNVDFVAKTPAEWSVNSWDWGNY